MLSINIHNKLPVYILTFCLSLISLVIGFKINLLKVEAGYTSAINIPLSYVNIGAPHGMVMAADNNIWYVDTLNVRLVKYNPVDNSIVRIVGRTGTDDGEFNSGIYNITQDNDGNLYVLSAFAWVYKLDSNGGFLAKYDLRKTSDGGSMSELNGLGDPRGITYDSYSDTILITNHNNNRVERFTKNLTFISGFGSSGSGDYQFNGPWGITTDSIGRIYVADEYDTNSRIMIYSTSYSYIDQIKNWTDENENPQGFTGGSAVKDILILSDGTITVTAQNGNRIVQFDSSRHYLRTWGFTGPYVEHFIGPEFMVKDSFDNIYTSDIGRKTIWEHSSTGTYKGSLSPTGLEEGKLYNPIDVSYDTLGDMYVIDWGGAVVEFTSSGTWIGNVIDENTPIIGGNRNGLGSQYEHIAFHNGKIYTSNENDVLEFSYVTDHWESTAVIGTGGSGNGQFSQARGISFDADGNLYITDLGNQRVQKFVLNNSTYVYNSQLTIDTLGLPREAVVDILGNIYVVNEDSILKYTSMTDNNPTSIGTGHSYTGTITIDRSVTPNLIYVSEQHAYTENPAIRVYNTSTGALVDSFGTYGGGQVQFAEAWGTAINPLDGTITVCDPADSRVESFTDGYYRILNLIPSANVISLASGVSNGKSLSEQPWLTTSFTDAEHIPARLYFGDYVVADFTVDLSQGDLDWSAVNVQFLPATSKALVVNLNEDDAPGISATHSLYVYRYNNQTEVWVCPSASNLSEVGPTCNPQFPLTMEDPEFVGEGYTATLSIPDPIGGKSYWKIDGLVGTGAFSTLFETGFILKDDMTRLKVNTASDHNILFGTTYGLTHTGDTIKLTFGPDWDFGDLLAGNLSLIDDGGSPLTLSADGPDTDTWGYSIVSDEFKNEIILMAPTDGIGYIAAGSTISLLINDEVVINPAVAESYQIDVRLDSDTDPGPADVEVGSVDVSIVDSDQVNITAFVNAFMSFDIDTTTPDSGVTYYPHCNSDSCLPYEGSTNPASNYTVDLGELKSTYVNLSGESRMHSDGNPGKINSIYLNLSTNAQSGAIVEVTSASDNGLVGPNGSNITPIDDGTTIAKNSGKYGFNVADSSSVAGEGVGTNSSCNVDDSTHYCGSTTTPKEVFNTSSSPIDTARVRMDIAAAATYTNTPGSYTDTLTFVATAEF